MFDGSKFTIDSTDSPKEQPSSPHTQDILPADPVLVFKSPPRVSSRTPSSPITPSPVALTIPAKRKLGPTVYLVRKDNNFDEDERPYKKPRKLTWIPEPKTPIPGGRTGKENKKVDMLDEKEVSKSLRLSNATTNLSFIRPLMARRKPTPHLDLAAIATGKDWKDSLPVAEGVNEMSPKHRIKYKCVHLRRSHSLPLNRDVRSRVPLKDPAFWKSISQTGEGDATVFSVTKVAKALEGLSGHVIEFVGNGMFEEKKMVCVSVPKVG